tara:strand:- start:57 stop:1667 length:1611 start_codon:yes stop_codon:yes gene_type:complete
MATKKISDFTATTTPTSSATFAIVQSSSNLKVTLANIAANMPDLTATSISSSGTITSTGGFVGNLTGNVTGTASSATALATARTIGMTGDVTWTSASFDGSGNVTGTAAIGTGVIVNADVNTSAAIDASKIHDGTISNTEFGYLNNVSGNIQTQLDAKASSTYVPTTITVADESSDTTCFPLFATAATGDLGPKTASGLTFNSSTDVLSGTFSGNLTGNVTGNTSGTSGSTTGNAATATALATARNIGGVSFDGTGNIDLPGVNTAGNQNTSGSAASLSATLAVASGGTNITSYTTGDIIYASASGTLAKLGIGSTGQVLTVDSGLPSYAATASSVTFPTVTGISPSTITNDATSITLTGTNFVNGCHVEAISSTGAIFTPNSVSFTNATTVVANFTIGTDGTYFIRVENPDGLAVRSSSAILTVSDAPTWSTSAGSIGTVAAGASVSLDVDATSDSTVAFSETTSVLTSNTDTPASTMNLTLNSSTGAITGTAPSPTSETTYNFTLRATDAESQTADRAFSITISVGMNNTGQFN